MKKCFFDKQTSSIFGEVVFEATGKYHRALVNALELHDIAIEAVIAAS